MNKKFTTFEIEKYKGRIVLVSDNENPHVYRDEVACIAGNAIFLHLDAYRLIQESTKFKVFLETILEHEANNGTGHTHSFSPSKREQEVLDYLKERRYFETC